MKFNVYVTNDEFKGNPAFAEGLTENVEAHSEDEAISLAEQFTATYQDSNVYVFFQRSDDGQTGFLNKDGTYDLQGESWTEVKGGETK